MSKDEAEKLEAGEQPAEEPAREAGGGEATEIRRLNIGLHVAAQIALAALLFILINYLSFRHYGRKDLTDDQRYTVDPDTASFLQRLDQNVKITMAFSKGSRIYPQLSALLDQYVEHSGGKIQVEKFDPGREKVRALEFRDEMKMPLEGNMVILDFDGRKKTITEAEMLAEDGRLFFGEDVITSRIVGVTQEGDQKIYFLSSYGGPKLVDGKTAYARLVELAALQFAKVEMLSLADVNEIPGDADAIVLLNPEKDLEGRDIDLLRYHWEVESGSFLVMLNPQQETPRLDRFLDSVGVTRRDDRVLHLVNSVIDSRPELRAQGRFLSGSPITSRGLAETVTTFNGVTNSLDLATDDPALTQEGIVVKPLKITMSDRCTLNMPRCRRCRSIPRRQKP